MFAWPSKDPDELLDYQFDWTLRLDVGETISTSTFILDAGTIALSNESINGTKTTVWASGGAEGEVAEVTNRITTSVGRIYDATAKLRIRSH